MNIIKLLIKFTLILIISFTSHLWATDSENNNYAQPQQLLVENNPQLFAIQLGLGITNTSENTPIVLDSPTFMYRKRNILGTGNNLMVVFKGIYLGMDFIIPERPDLPLAFSFHMDGLFLPAEFYFIEDGKVVDWNIKSPFYNGGLTVEKSISSGLLISTSHNVRFNDYRGGISGFTRPDNNVTYTGDLKLMFATMKSVSLNPFNPSTGFSISLTPSIVFKPNYRSWGPDNDLYTHNELPEIKFISNLYYGGSPSKQLFFGGSLSYYGGNNYYESEKWAVGPVTKISPGPRLSGYQPGEYRSEKALAANLDAYFQLVQDKLLLLARHDIYYDMDEFFFKQGSALGVAMILPYQIKLNVEAGIGWDAERDTGPGWTIDIALSGGLLVR